MKRTAIALCAALAAAPAFAQQPTIDLVVTAYIGGPSRLCEVSVYATNSTEATVSLSGRLELVRPVWNDMQWFSIEYISPGQRKNASLSFEGDCSVRFKATQAIVREVSCRSGGKAISGCAQMLRDHSPLVPSALPLVVGAE